MAGARKTRRASRKMRGGMESAGMMPAGMMPAGETAPGPTATPMMGGKMPAIGSRAEVMHGTAHHTSGGLTRKDLKYNKAGRIVSRKASEAGKKALKRLVKAGYKARKGQFKLFTKKSSRRH